jgi:hypothetical protein
VIVPGCGLSQDGSRWISCKLNFLLPGALVDAGHAAVSPRVFTTIVLICAFVVERSTAFECLTFIQTQEA